MTTTESIIQGQIDDLNKQLATTQDNINKLNNGIINQTRILEQTVGALNNALHLQKLIKDDHDKNMKNCQSVDAPREGD